jgi:hypothetical protein
VSAFRLAALKEKGALSETRDDLLRAAVLVELFDRYKSEIAYSLAVEECTLMNKIDSRKAMLSFVGSIMPHASPFLTIPKFAPFYFVLNEDDYAVIGEPCTIKSVEQYCSRQSILNRLRETVDRWSMSEASSIPSLERHLLISRPLREKLQVFQDWAVRELLNRSQACVKAISILEADIRRINSQVLQVRRKLKLVQAMRLG